MNVREILKQWLIDNDYDGLQHESDCGCQVSDLVPCGEGNLECEAGHKREAAPKTGYDFLIFPGKKSK